MPNAVITDSFLTTTPWDRKTHLYPAIKTALTNAGFTTDINEYDRTDDYAQYWFTTNAAFQANGISSIRGIIKQVVFNGSKAKGTLQFDFFSTKSNTYNNFRPTSPYDYVSSNDYANQFTILGVAAYTGGWDSTNARRTDFLNSGSAIGSWFGIKPTSTANMHNSDSQMQSACLNGNFSSTNDTTWNSSLHGFAPAGMTFSAGRSNESNHISNFYGQVSSSNVLQRALNPNIGVQFKAINHPEIRGIFVLQQFRAPMFYGYVRPANIPSWWNEDLFPYCFIPYTPHFNQMLSFSGTGFPISGTPYHAAHELTAGTGLTAINSLNSKIDVQSGPVIRYAAKSTILGKFSSDLLSVPSISTVSQFDRLVVTSGVQEYLVLSATRTTADPYLAIRVV